MNSSEILIEIYTFSFTKMHLKMSYGKGLPFCLSLKVLKQPQSILDPVIYNALFSGVFATVVLY